MALSDEDKFFLIEKMTVYAIVVMSLFLKNTYNYETLNEYEKLQAGIIKQYKKFTWDNCGADNEKDKEYYWNTIKNSFFINFYRILRIQRVPLCTLSPY